MSEGHQSETVAAGKVQAASPTTKPVDVGIASGLQFRVDERYEIDGDGEVIVKGGSLGTALLRGSILDISATGCYIRTLARVPVAPGT